MTSGMSDCRWIGRVHAQDKILVDKLKERKKFNFTHENARCQSISGS